MTRRTETSTLASAMYTLARDIDSADGVANAAIFEAAERLELQQHEIKRLLRLLGSVVKHYGEDGNGPGHAHLRPGVWDDDNKPEIAGKPCEWCATWREILEAVK